MNKRPAPSDGWRGTLKVLVIFLALTIGLMALELAMQHAHQGKWFLFSR